MIVLRIVNQQLVQVVLAAGQQPSRQFMGAVLASGNKQLLNSLLTRTLVLSASRGQKTTNANNQQLIPVARNISFRQCRHSELSSPRTSEAASFSISAASPQAHLMTAEYLDSFSSAVIDDQADQTRRRLAEQERQARESPFELLKRHAKDVREKRARNRYYGQSFNEAMATTATGEASERRLVVLLSWLEAKEKHIEKYRQFYLDRGFDVLNVKTSPLDLLLPNFGARKISEDFVKFMVEKQYSNVVLHGFSVGGYMFGRFLLEMDSHSAELRDKLLKSIRGVVFDSLVPFEGIAPGVSKSITRNPVGSKILEQLLRLYLVVGKNLATRHYLEVSEKVWGGPLRCPTLFLMSRDDNISDHRIVERLAATWSSLGIECRKMLVDSSPHVQLFMQHQDRYVEEVDNFLKHIKAPPKPLPE